MRADNQPTRMSLLTMAVGALASLFACQAWGMPIIDQIEAQDGISLVRVNNSKDQIWTNGAGTSWITARARDASYNNVFGVVPGVGGGSFQALSTAPSTQGVISLGAAPLVPIDALVADGADFRVAIKTPVGNIWTSLSGDNSDGADHMITWVDAADPTHYFVGFEDLVAPGWDADFNDLVLELFNVIDGESVTPQALLVDGDPRSVPEPATLALMGLGFLGVGFRVRRRSR
jgi:hypothetical protein